MSARRTSLGGLVLLIVVLIGIVGAGVWKGGWQASPKLALDLEGGTQIILQASTTDGSAIDADSMDQAREIISQRVNAMGVAETEISVQGGTNIVVDVPGNLDSETREALGATAALSFRPVLATLDPSGTGSAKASDDGGSGPSDEVFSGAITLDDPYAPNSTAQATGASDASDGASDGGGDGSSSDVPAAWSSDWATTALQSQAAAVDCTDPKAQQEIASSAPNSQPVVACSDDGSAKYLLGPEVLPGTVVTNASVGSDTNSSGQATGSYLVNMQFTSEGSKTFGTMTNALYNKKGATDSFAIVLDGQVVSAPYVQTPSSNGASISGNFDQDTAKQLADQLKFGALPLQFDIQSEQQISATLGGDQLEKGLIAGIIGLILVVAYAALQYRVLSIVTTSSLVVTGVLTYLTLTVLSHIPEIGYRLSLAGVTGLIVAIAFTADSFIVYFERVRDEIRDGRGIVAAVDHGWNRAKRTILASDTVNLIASIVLYVLSTGSVRGFAFTLGLTTIMDLVVVFLFTHPLLQTLVRSRFFGKGHPMSGLDPAQLGRQVPTYAGRGRVRSAAERGPVDGADDEAPVRETLAQRKARLAREAREGASTGETDQKGTSADPGPDPGGEDSGSQGDEDGSDAR
ncbi:protein translocase subunit SecD [Brachybacterium sp. ACRRE]|uniref:protein translocase subunit SecD n=1 Tax=Brachybacterium sp. ACRRE TaxID=2918184 RepID=UPI001EF30D31|nr:protein translocase subunit SecD [Brachybacterium sp. ACRRE]MCG7309908.1 protein translocase subunit SecD [Brachybacterium sp. ACRRE]